MMMTVQRIAMGMLGWVLCATLASAQEVSKTVFSKWQAKADPAVERALQYLAKEQQPGSSGIPSLVAMAFLSKGYTPTEGRYKVTINRCIDFVLQSQQRNGVINEGSAGSGPMYAHNISTLFLSEISGMVDPERQKRIARALPRALKVILDAQRIPKGKDHQGGWRYHPHSTDSDTSCSGWGGCARPCD